MTLCENDEAHLWKTVHKASDGGSTTWVEWCQVCGTVRRATRYHELLKTFEDEFVPTGKEK